MGGLEGGGECPPSDIVVRLLVLTLNQIGLHVFPMLFLPRRLAVGGSAGQAIVILLNSL